MSIKDENKLPELEKRLKDMDGKSVQIGFLGQDFTNIIANVHEFGTTIKPKKGKYLAIPIRRESKGKSPRDFQNLTFIPRNKDSPILAIVEGTKVTPLFLLKRKVTIPERSFLRTSFDDKKNVRKIVDKAKDIYDVKIDPIKILDRIGLLMVAEIQKKIKSNIQPENAPITTEMKGGKTKTLVDTGRMAQGVTHKVK